MFNQQSNQSQPLIVTHDQLIATLAPLTVGYKWGQEALRELWRMGAPTPDSTIHNERRIILPQYTKRWLVDVCQRNSITAEQVSAAFKRFKG